MGCGPARRWVRAPRGTPPGIADIEYSGHFGAAVYFSCSVEDRMKVEKAVVSLLKRFWRNCKRSAAYRKHQERG